MVPTKTLRTHYMILQDGRQFPITQELYNNVRDAKTTEKATSFFLLRDPDTQEVLFDGELRAIKEFKEISKKDNWIKWWFCWFGNLHTMKEPCNCSEKYWVSESKFRTQAYELYGKKHTIEETIGSQTFTKTQYDSLYLQDLTYQERNICIEACK